MIFSKHTSRLSDMVAVNLNPDAQQQEAYLNSSRTEINVFIFSQRRRLLLLSATVRSRNVRARRSENLGTLVDLAGVGSDLNNVTMYLWVSDGPSAQQDTVRSLDHS